MDSKSVIIIGGGLAGLTAAIHLSKLGIEVTIIERNHFPKHKVCGEYVSNEVLPYLQWLDADPFALHPVSISRLLFSDVGGRTLEADLPLGGFGISRYALDFWLYQKAKQNGCRFIHNTVSDVRFSNDMFRLLLSDGTSLTSKVVLGAFGKRSNLDIKLERKFTATKSPWLAVKSHYKGEWPSDVVALHNFNGGYCGVSKVEGSRINVCYLASFNSFKKHKNIQEYQQNVLSQNPHLRKVFNGKPLFDSPMAISQIAFDRKFPVENHILMIGDTAGLIHPLCGNGMAMAIHSAKIASVLTEKYLTGEFTRNELEASYAAAYNQHFQKRLTTGRLLAAALRNDFVTGTLIKTMVAFPGLLPQIIKRTHGEPIRAVA